MAYGAKAIIWPLLYGLHTELLLIDRKGIIKKIFFEAKNKQHAEEISKAMSGYDFLQSTFPCQHRPGF